VPLRVNPVQTGLLQRMGLRGGSLR
jgi:hypothetical protein